MERRTEVLGFGAVSRSARLAGLAVACLIGLMAFTAHASAFEAKTDAINTETQYLPGGVQRTTYAIGPLNVTPGQNRISFAPIVGEDRPAEDGWITRIEPNLVRPDGSIPTSNLVMFHHGVWLNASRPDATMNGMERFYATGEEKTIMQMPDGYGYRYKKSDTWLLNHMIHNLVSEPMTLYATYTVDFIPDTAPQAAGMIPVRPIWMDVQNGSIYPVFDVFRDSGGQDGEFTYPTDEPKSPYSPNNQKNEWTVDQDGVLVGTTGHVHTGGLSTDLYLKREGASYNGPTCPEPSLVFPQDALDRRNAKLKKLSKKIKQLSKKAKKAKKKKAKKKVKKRIQRSIKKTRKAKKRQLRSKQAFVQAENAKIQKEKDDHAACVETMPRVEGNRVHLFESAAHYFEPAGPVSWDVAMISTAPDWRVEVKKGDVLELTTTYETKLASWYESMGINIAYMAPPGGGHDPYTTRVDQPGVLNHGHYPENDIHGGGEPEVGPDPSTLPNGVSPTEEIPINGFAYGVGDFRMPGSQGNPAVVEQGESLTFRISDYDQSNEIWHSLTSCKSPCNKSTGIAYPIADGDFQFDSGQLGEGGPPTVNRRSWTTPKDLPVGTHTYFCRIHPEMRGAIRVVPKGSL